ncbi:hypothetical protein ACBJ59_50855 [Nonomuraea sp. MTCD27]|uniref:hypothetical protein n=1 Tax=Nonomuraea sp. MTCD27 TaxID=1676747 RepID=UPI0035BEF97E
MRAEVEDAMLDPDQPAVSALGDTLLAHLDRMHGICADLLTIARLDTEIPCTAGPSRSGRPGRRRTCQTSFQQADHHRHRARRDRNERPATSGQARGQPPRQRRTARRNHHHHHHPQDKGRIARTPSRQRGTGSTPTSPPESSSRTVIGCGGLSGSSGRSRPAGATAWNGSSRRAEAAAITQAGRRGAVSQRGDRERDHGDGRGAGSQPEPAGAA